jgi:Ca-activated chloride channel homolog
VREDLDYLEADSGTAIGLGLLSAVKLVQTSLASDGVVRTPGKSLPAAIVLLSDGKQTQGRIQPLAAAATASAAGIPVDTVALGTRHGVLGVGAFAPKVPPDPPLMRAIARETGGKTSKAVDSTQLDAFYRTVGSSIGRTTESRPIASWFALAAAGLLLGAVGFGRVWAGALS